MHAVTQGGLASESGTAETTDQMERGQGQKEEGPNPWATDLLVNGTFKGSRGKERTPALLSPVGLGVTSPPLTQPALPHPVRWHHCPDGLGW